LFKKLQIQVCIAITGSGTRLNNNVGRW